MTYNFKERVCNMCSLKYKPTGSAQKFCPPCGVINRKEKNLEWYHNCGGLEYNREYKRQTRDSWVDIEDHVSPEKFAEVVNNIIDKQRGSMMSTKSTTRRALKDLNIYDVLWGQKRNRGGIATRLYQIVIDIFEERGGVYHGTTVDAGDQYQFPLKERKI